MGPSRWEQRTKDRPTGVSTSGRQAEQPEDQAGAGSPGPEGCRGRDAASEASGSVRAEEKPLGLATMRSQVTSHRALADGTLSSKQSTPPRRHSWAQPPPGKSSPLTKALISFSPPRTLRRLDSQLVLFEFALVILLPCTRVLSVVSPSWARSAPSSADTGGFPEVWVTLTDSRKQEL